MAVRLRWCSAVRLAWPDIDEGTPTCDCEMTRRYDPKSFSPRASDSKLPSVNGSFLRCQPFLFDASRLRRSHLASREHCTPLKFPGAYPDDGGIVRRRTNSLSRNNSLHGKVQIWVSDAT